MITPLLNPAMFLGISLLLSGITLSILCGALGIVVAVLLIGAVLRADKGTEKMLGIASAIQEGAKAYLNRQITTISVIAVVIFILLLKVKGLPVSIGFLIGAVCSLAAGYVGMRVAVVANVRTAAGALKSRQAALRMAFSGGAVTGLLVVGLGLVAVGLFYLVGVGILGVKETVNSLVGLALGASLISVFARLGGGIYTKAADVGADLVGKIEQNLDEDDPRNPATIADNVGDNVGDCAGMAADVFETFAVSLIGAVLVAYLMVQDTPAAIVYPFVLGGISVIGSILGILYVNASKARPDVALMMSVGISALFSAICFWPATWMLFPEPIHAGALEITPLGLYFSALIGLVLTAAVVLITNYFTSTAYEPVRRIARASVTGHGTNIIAGIAVGNHATVLPAILIIAAILGSYNFGGLYGVAVAVMSMLSLSGIIISLDAFGPITDNAGGIAVMSESPKSVREITDELDAVGNTMKAVT